MQHIYYLSFLKISSSKHHVCLIRRKIGRKREADLSTSGGSGSDFFGFGLSQGTLFRVRVHRVCHLEQLSGSGFNDSGFRVERV